MGKKNHLDQKLIRARDKKKSIINLLSACKDYGTQRWEIITINSLRRGINTYSPFNPIIQFLTIYSIKIIQKKKDVVCMKMFTLTYKWKKKEKR